MNINLSLNCGKVHLTKNIVHVHRKFLKLPLSHIFRRNINAPNVRCIVLNSVNLSCKKHKAGPKQIREEIPSPKGKFIQIQRKRQVGSELRFLAAKIFNPNLPRSYASPKLWASQSFAPRVWKHLEKQTSSGCDTQTSHTQRRRSAWSAAEKKIICFVFIFV